VCVRDGGDGEVAGVGAQWWWQRCSRDVVCARKAHNEHSMCSLRAFRALGGLARVGVVVVETIEVVEVAGKAALLAAAETSSAVCVLGAWRMVQLSGVCR
jgi:hypothetical protein